MPERKYRLHVSENYFGKRSDQKSVKEGLGEILGNRYTAVNQYQKYENKWRRELKSLKKYNKILFSMAKRLGSRCELKNIKNICIRE